MTESKILVFQVGGQDFGADVHEVREVIPAPDVTQLPRAEPPVIGVFNLRGNIVTAVDGGQALGLRESAGGRSRGVVSSVEGHLYGLLVDTASEVLTVGAEAVRPAPTAGAAGEAATGVVLLDERPIILLSFPKLFARPGRREGSAVEEACPR